MISNKGFRLKYFEVRNFGSYHKRTTRFDFDGHDGVFTGPNGAGKSTALDAFRVLISKRPHFNSASGEVGSSGRTLQSYYVGTFTTAGRSGADVGETTLRGYGHEPDHMALLAVFENASGECFTVGRMLLLKTPKMDSAVWRNFSAPVALSLESHFGPWMTAGRLSEHLSSLGGTLHGSASDYFDAFARYIGFEDGKKAEAAFRHLENSIGVKQMVSVNSFAQDYLLPTSDFEKGVKNALDQLTGALDAIQVARTEAEKIEMIRKLPIHMGEAHGHGEDVRFISGQKRVSETLRSLVERQVKRIARRNDRSELARTEERKAELDSEMENLETERESIERSLGTDSGRRLLELGRESDALGKEVRKRDDRLALISAEARSIGIDLKADTFEEWDAGRTKIDRKLAGAESEGLKLVEQRTAHLVTERQIETERNTARNRLAEIERNKSNLHPSNFRFRDALSNQLGLSEDQMPFVCELIRVRPGEEEWEGVANRVLNGPGQQLLVPPQFYDDAVVVMNRGRWGGKVTLCDTRKEFRQRISDLRSDSLGRKLEVKDHDFAYIAESIVAQNADHACVTEGTIKAASGKAVTAQGTIKNNWRAEKDDRHAIDDRTRFILGWDNKALIDLWTEKLNRIEADLDQSKRISSEFNVGIAHHKKIADTCQRIMAQYVSYADIETVSLTSRIKDISFEQEKLQSSELRSLVQRRDAIKTRLSECKKQREECIGDIAALRNNISGHETAMIAEANVIRTCLQANGNDPAIRLDCSQRAALRQLLVAHCGVPEHKQAQAFTTYVNSRPSEALRDFRRLGEILQNAIARARNARQKALQAMKDTVNAYLYKWNEETLTLERGILLADESDVDPGVYHQWMKELDSKVANDITANIPAMEEELKGFQETHLAVLHSEDQAYSRAVSRMMKVINDLLMFVPYDPVHNTRVRFAFAETGDEDVRAFRARLRDLAQHAHTKSNDEAVKAFVDLLRPLQDDGTVETRGLRDKILNLAKWKDIWVEEFKVTEDGSNPTLRVYEGSQAASGGQAERLTMLMIGAAQAYAMGGADPSKTPTGLSLIIIDEAFLRSSPETAVASRRILSALGLQVIAATPQEKLGAFQGGTGSVFVITSRRNQILAQRLTYEAMERAIETGEFPEAEMLSPTIAGADEVPRVQPAAAPANEATPELDG